MFDKWLNLPAHLYLRITALTILTVGIALSNVLMSIGAIWIISNWLIEADFKGYVQKLKNKKSVWFILFIFFFIALSLMWSSDFDYGFKDLRVKLPFIAIPLVMATSAPLEKKHFYFLLYVFLGILVYTSVYNFVRYNFYLKHPSDIREMSNFISHVRFAVLINLGIFTSIYLIYQKRKLTWLWTVLIVWLLFYLFKSQILNGYILFVVLSVFAILFFTFKFKSIRLKWVVLSSFIAVFGAILFVLMQFISQINPPTPIRFADLDLYTPNGNPYHHDTLSTEQENGFFVWLYVNQDEMKREWEKRSTLLYDSLDHVGQPMFGTLMRFLTSKGARKDSVGVAQLTDDEIRRIENGQTSISINKGLITRLNSFFYEYEIYKQGGDPNGHSLIQRIEHLKAAKEIVASNRWLGVGVGDVPDAFEKQYQRMNSRLAVENQHRSHNQYLTMWVSIGVLGFVAFVLALIWPFIELKKLDYFSLIVLLSLIVSCLFEDFIETQAGVTIFALFYSLAVYRPQELEQNDHPLTN